MSLHILSKIVLTFNLAQSKLQHIMSKIEDELKDFVGRKLEINKLINLLQLARSKIVVIKGRRRVGKSRLVLEFAKNKTFLSLAGLAPVKGVKAQDQRNSFAKQFSEQCHIPAFSFFDWSDGFAQITSFINQHESKPIVILLDEISWMGSKDPTFIPKLKVWWDEIEFKYQNVILVLCGSVSTWIEKNIINSTSFFGRITLTMTLQELSMPECYQLLKIKGFNRSYYDIFKILSITGGVPWYLQQINPQLTADENIKQLCFENDGVLTSEFDRIFHDLFNKKYEIYKKIIYLLNDGMKDLKEIRTLLNYQRSGSLTKHLNVLIVCGFITKHQKWSIKSGKLSAKDTLYRLSDNYIRFYLKYIEPNLSKIKQNYYRDISLNALAGFETWMGFQVENLLLKNRITLIKKLGIDPHDIVFDNPYVQRAKSRQRGCQIDYLIQTDSKNLFACEFKFQKRELKFDIIDSVKDKINRFVYPRGFAVCPVLVHLSGVNHAVEDSRYFYRIIDLVDFLEED